MVFCAVASWIPLTASGGAAKFYEAEAEVDLVLGDGSAVLESKFKNKVDSRELRGGLRFAREKKLKRLFVATEELRKVEDIEGVEVRFIPGADILLSRDGSEM